MELVFRQSSFFDRARFSTELVLSPLEASSLLQPGPSSVKIAAHTQSHSPKLLPLIESVNPTRAHLHFISTSENCRSLWTRTTHVDNPRTSITILLQPGTFRAIVRVGDS